jgi:hypothetical protein
VSSHFYVSFLLGHGTSLPQVVTLLLFADIVIDVPEGFAPPSFCLGGRCNSSGPSGHPDPADLTQERGPEKALTKKCPPLVRSYGGFLGWVGLVACWFVVVMV